MTTHKAAFIAATMLSVTFLFTPANSGRSGETNEKLPYLDPRLPVEQRVADLLGRMNLEEKVAQTEALCDLKIHIMDDQGNFSPERAQGTLNHGIGELTRTSLGVNGVENGQVKQLTKDKGPKDNAVFNNAVQKFLVEHTRLGIPAIVHEESLHGLMALKGTSFPQAIALASTWDVDLVEQVFAAAADEARSRGAHQVLTPVLDVARDPRWGRTEETYGEDPYLVSRLGVACIRGFQGRSTPTIGDHHVIATAKHFAVHGQPEGGMNVGPGNYSERIVREVFLPPFQAAFMDAGAMSVMASYNEVDGIPSHANRWLLGKILRQEWGFQGFVVSDYSGISDLANLHHVVANKAEAAKRALEAGVDLELPDIECYDTLAGQVRGGLISEATLDKAVARILRAKFLLGLFENPCVDPDLAEKTANRPDHRQLAAKAAREAIVLLKNQDHLLPLDAHKVKSIAVIGPNAALCHLGGYSADPGATVSILEGIRNKVGSRIEVHYAEGCRITNNDQAWRSWSVDEVEWPVPAEDDQRIGEAVKAARAADVVLLALGGNEQTCREGGPPNHFGDRDSLDLLGRQNDLVKAILATGKPAVAFLINGRPLSINYLAESVPAILEGWYLGEETGTAVADVLFGDYNPAGRLPITFPRSAGQIPAFYNHKPSARGGYLGANKEPLYAFGFGLSYTTFKYDNLKLAPNRIGTAGKATLSVEVTNTGDRAGDEVVQAYIRDEVSSVTRPVKELKGFRRINLAPGQTKLVEFEIGPEALSFLNEGMKRVVEPGTFDIMVGPNSTDLKAAKLEVVEP